MTRRAGSSFAVTAAATRALASCLALVIAGTCAPVLAGESPAPTDGGALVDASVASLPGLAGIDLATLLASTRTLIEGAASAASAVSDETLPRAQRVPDRLRIKRVTAGADGKSYLDVIELPVVSHTPGQSILSRLYTTDVELGYGVPGTFIDWHRVTTPRLWILLQGAWDFGTGDGMVHRLVAGDIVLAADTTGQGHTSRNVGTVPSFVLTVRLPATDSLAPKLSQPPVPKPE